MKSDSSASVPDEKGRLECEKLRLEIHHLQSRPRRLLTYVSAVSSLLVAVVAIYAVVAGSRLVTQQRERLEHETWYLGLRNQRISDIESAWTDLSRLILDEPSGLAAMNIEWGPQSPLVLAVDDEMDQLFVLRPLDDDKILVWKMLTLVGDDAGFNDPEAVCFDGERFHAVGSHRRVGRTNVMSVLHFEIQATHDRDIAEQVQFEREGLNPRLLGESLADAGAIENFSWGEHPTIDGLDWSDDENPEYEYALQIEGAACNAARLLIGLRFPTWSDDGDAPRRGRKPILLRYPMDRTSLSDVQPQVFKLEIRSEKEDVGTLLEKNDYGITSLDDYERDDRTLVVAALNPPRNDAYNASILAWYEESGNGFGLVDAKAVARRDAKLEAIAVVGEELWLLYEGLRTYFERHALADFVPTL